jgi:hypothetical protein
MSGLSPIPQTAVITDGNGNLTPTFQGWFQSIYKWLSPVGQSGTSTNRPTKNLYVGQPFFDTTLALPIWVQSLNPTVWCNGSGTAV